MDNSIQKSGFSSETNTFYSLTPSVSTLLPPETSKLSVASYSFALQLTSRWPDATALIDSGTGQRLSYSQFTSQARNLSSSLYSKFGISKGDVAFILSPNSIQVPLLYFSLLSLGVVVSPSNPASTESEISRQIRLTKPVIAFATSATSHKLPVLQHGTILTDSAEFLSMTMDSSIQLPRLEVSQSDIAAIMYSSGTTGQIKGVMLTHRNLTAIVAHYYAQRPERKSPEVVLYTVPYFHVIGFFYCLKSVALTETVVVMNRFDLRKMLRSMEEFRVTNVVGAPPVVVAMTKGEITNKYDLKSLEGFGCGGAPLGKDVIGAFKAKFPGVILSQRMGGHRGAQLPPMSWSDSNERAFIEILFDWVKSQKTLQTSTPKDEVMNKINKAMIDKTGTDYGIKRLKGKWNRLRMNHRFFSDLLGHTGVTWDPNTNQVLAAEEVWQHFYTINKDQYKCFKKEGFKHYEILGEIFCGTTATGGLGNASTQLPQTSEEERDLEDDFLTKGVHVVNDDVSESSKTRQREEIGTSSERRRKEPKVSKSDKLEACMAQWSSTVSMRSEEAELRKLYLKEKVAKLQGKPGIADDSEATSPDPYSNAVCLGILNGMEGVSNEVYMKAITKFKDPDFRMSFVMMPEYRRGPILDLL